MRRTIAISRALPAALVLLSGCATMEPKKGFEDVSRLVGDRGGFVVHWRTGGPEDARVEEHVHALLAKELTADLAVEVALLNSPRLQATYEELGIAQADLVQAGLLKNPTLGAGLQFPLDPTGVIAPSFSIAQEFLDLFLLPLRRRFAALQFEQAKLRVGNEVLSVAAEVRGAFYEVQAAEQLLRVRRTILDAERVAAELSRRQHDAQNISDLDFINQIVTYEQLRQDLLRDEYALRAHRERLNRLLGVWGKDTGWKVAGSLPDLPKEDPVVEGLETRAVTQRLDLAVARKEVEALSSAFAVRRGNALVGSVEVGAEAGRDTEGHREIGPSLRLQLPIFDQGQASIGKLEAELRQARAREAELAVRVRSEVRETRSRLEEARMLVETDRTSLIPLRERIVALSQQNYNAMLLGVFQLLQAKQAELNAYREYVDAVREYWTARAELERVVGGRLDVAAPPPSPAPAPSPDGASTSPSEHTR